MSEKQLVVFTMKGCPWCEDMKKSLKENEIDFLNRDINEYEEEYELFVEITENDFVPSFMIIEDVNDLSKTKLYAPDRDFDGIEQGLEIIKESFKK
jgi:glutaredoxin